MDTREYWNNMIDNYGCAVIPGTAKSIPDGAFAGNERLKRVVIREGVKEIGSQAFYDCPLLKTVELPKGLEKILFAAFDQCDIVEVHLPGSIVEINGNPFMENRNMGTITIEDSPIYRVEGNCLLTREGKMLVAGTVNSVIPDSVRVIGPCAFEGISIKELTLPNSLRKIERFAFSGCQMLKNVEIPDRVTDIDNNAFADCRSLKSIRLPKQMARFNPSIIRGDSSLEKIVCDSERQCYRIEDGCLLSMSRDEITFKKFSHSSSSYFVKSPKWGTMCELLKKALEKIGDSSNP